jgi:hypothetical protein
MAPAQPLQALPVQVWVPVLQLPQLRVPVPKQPTHVPVAGRHSGVLPVQDGVWFIHAPAAVHKRGVVPRHP